MKPVYYILLVFSMMSFPLAADIQIILSEGPIKAQSLPGFGPNVLTSYSASYKTPSGTKIKVYATTEKLLCNPAYWSEVKLGVYKVWKTQNDTEGQIWCVQRNLVLRDELKAYSAWYYVIQTEAAIASSFMQSFIENFVPRFEYFLTQLKRLQDLSFPAMLIMPD